MPIPVSVTGWAGPQQQRGAAELETSGPFARAASAAPSQPLDAAAAGARAAVEHAEAGRAGGEQPPVLDVRGLSFWHTGLDGKTIGAPVLTDVAFSLPAGARCLLARAFFVWLSRTPRKRLTRLRRRSSAPTAPASPRCCASSPAARSCPTAWCVPRLASSSRRLSPLTPAMRDVARCACAAAPRSTTRA